MKTSRLVLVGVCTALAVAAMAVPAQAQRAPATIGAPKSSGPTRDADRQRATAAFNHLPIRFEPTGPEGTFLARGIGAGVRLNGRSIDFPLGTDADGKGSIRVQFVGARKSSRVSGVDLLPGRVNYLYGDDPKNWRTNVPTYALAHTTNLYRGIDVDYYGAGDLLEYDFIVRPGARVESLRLTVSGERAAINENGDLVCGADRRVLLRKPRAYQTIDGVHRDVSVEYRHRRDGTFGFSLGSYDRHAPLVIDPVLVYSFNFQGGVFTSIFDFTVDDSGAVYVGGSTFTADFPTLHPAGNRVDAGANACYDQTIATLCSDSFLAKVTADGSELEYETYFGHSGWDEVDHIAVDAHHALYFVSNWRTTPPTSLSNLVGSSIGKLAPDGTRFEYTFFTPSFDGDFSINGLAVGPDGSAYVITLSYRSAGLDVTNDVATLSPTGGNYHSIFTLNEQNGLTTTFAAITTGAGSVFVAGSTVSNVFPTTPGAAQTHLGGQSDGVIMRFTTDGRLMYSTFLGGPDDELIADVAVDAAGDSYVVGSTGGLFDRQPYVSKLSPDGSSVSPATVPSAPLGSLTSVPRIALDNEAYAYTVACGSTMKGPGRCDLWKIDPTGIVLRTQADVPSSRFAVDSAGFRQWFLTRSSFGPEIVKLGPALTLRSLAASTSFPVRFATPITWTIDAVAEDNANIDYSFWRYDESTGWFEVQAFGPSASYTWTPASWDVGDHAVCGLARVDPATAPVLNCVSFTITGVAPGESPVLPPAADFNSDRRPDLVWANTTTGELAVWNMGDGAYGERVIGGGYLNSPALPAGWRVAGTADIDGDGHTDLFLQSDTGFLGAWFFDGATLRSGVRLMPRQVQHPEWQIRAVGDVNHDGHPDLVWQDSITGQLAFWMMNGTTAIEYISSSVAPPSGDWEVVGVGDSNRDGNLDLFWQQRSTGRLAVWRMNQHVLDSGSYLSASPSDPKWRVVAVADLDGDGYSDLVLQNDDTGELGAWYLQDDVVRFGVTLNPRSVGDPAWRVAGPR